MKLESGATDWIKKHFGTDWGGSARCTLHTFLSETVHSSAQKGKKENLNSWSTLITLLKSVPAPALHSNDRLRCMSATPWAMTEEQRQQKHSWTECMHQHPAYKIISLHACEKAPVKHVSRARQASKNLFFLCLLSKKGNWRVRHAWMCNYTMCLHRSDKFNPGLSCKNTCSIQYQLMWRANNYTGLSWVTVTLFLSPFISSHNIRNCSKQRWVAG